MNALLLSLGLLAPTYIVSAGDHASLHPADAIFYLEVPDISAVATAYDKAPLLRFLADKEIASLFSELAMPIDPTPSAIADTIASELVGSGLDVKGSELISGLGTVSLSLGASGNGLSATILLDFTSPELCTKVMEALTGSLDGVEGHDLAGYQRFSMDESPFGSSAWLRKTDTRIAFGTDAASATAFDGRSRAEGTSFAANAQYKRALTTLGKPRGTHVLTLNQSASFAPIVQALAPDKAEEIMGSGLIRMLDNARSLRMDFTGNRFQTTMFSEGTSDGQVTGGIDLEDEWLATFPGEGMISYATTVNGRELGKLAKEIATALPGVTDGLNELESALGFGLERPLSMLGPRFMVSIEPISGLGLPPSYAWIDVSDPEGFERDLKAMIAGLAQYVPGLSARSREYRVRQEDGGRVAVPYTTITLPAEITQQMSMFAPKPSFARIGDRLLWSQSTISLKAELKRMYAGTAASRPNVLQSYQIPVAQGTRSIFVMDWNRLIEKLLGLAQAMGPMFADNIPFDLAKLPSPETIRRYFGPTIHVSRQIEGGLVRTHTSSFGPELILSAGLGGLGGLMANTAQASVPPPPVKESDH